jgi:hypothetical protein
MIDPLAGDSVLSSACDRVRLDPLRVLSPLRNHVAQLTRSAPTQSGKMHSNLGKVGGWDGTALSRWDNIIRKSMTAGETGADTLTLMNTATLHMYHYSIWLSYTYWATISAR